MTSQLPAPPTPADCDLRDFPFTPVFRARLFGSSFHARANDAEWRAGFTLWLKSWDQVPAGSLPDDDIDLCRLAELGRDLKAWRKLKAMALHGWIKCSDGRLYHPVVAQGIAEAWGKRSSAKKKGMAGASKRWSTGNAPAIESDSTGTAPAIAQAMPGDSKGSGREVEGRELPNRDVGVPPTGTARANGSHTAIEKGATSTAQTPIEAWWKSAQGIAATAQTVGMERRPNESDGDFKDRVYAAVQELNRKAQADAKKRQRTSTA